MAATDLIRGFRYPPAMDQIWTILAGPAVYGEAKY